MTSEASTKRHKHEYCPCLLCNTMEQIEAGIIMCIIDDCFARKPMPEKTSTICKACEEETETINEHGICYHCWFHNVKEYASNKKTSKEKLRISNTKRNGLVYCEHCDIEVDLGLFSDAWIQVQSKFVKYPLITKTFCSLDCFNKHYGVDYR